MMQSAIDILRENIGGTIENVYFAVTAGYAPYIGTPFEVQAQAEEYAQIKAGNRTDGEAQVEVRLVVRFDKGTHQGTNDAPVGRYNINAAGERV